MRLLVVDDHPINCKLLVAFLAKLEGVEVVSYQDPLEARAWLGANAVDMVLVDYCMPGMNGIEFISEFRAKAANDEIPIVMVTAESERTVLVEALEAGANDFLRKPVDPVELLARARNMLKLRARSQALAEANLRLEVLATIDSLTGACNRRFFLERLNAEVQRMRRHGHPLSLIMLDADHFKRINDTYGHATGDRVLVSLVERCQETLRDSDFIGRLGGEEFAIAAPETTLAGAMITAERLRQSVEAVRLDGVISFSISLGVAEFCPEDGNLQSLMHRADLAVYQSKTLLLRFLLV
ncbi:two-component system, cell cycle response regulator [uncultured Gammaproteobacteria bacterium]